MFKALSPASQHISTLSEAMPPLQEVSIGTSTKREKRSLSHIASMLEALNEIHDPEERSEHIEQTLEFIQQAIESLRIDEIVSPSLKLDLSLDPSRWQEWQKFGAGFQEILHAFLDGREPTPAMFTELETENQILLERVHEVFKLEELRNHCAALKHGISDEESAIAYLAKIKFKKCDELDFNSTNVTVEIPRPGVIRFFFSKELYLKMSSSDVEAFATTSNQANGLSFTSYKRDYLNQQEYRSKEIPHETMHTLWKTTAKVFNLHSNASSAEKIPNVDRFIFSHYLDECIAQLAGGRIFGYCNPIKGAQGQNLKELLKLQEPEIYESCESLMNDLYDLYHTNFPELVANAGLQPLALTPFLLGSSSMEELHRNLFSLKNHLSEALPQPVSTESSDFRLSV